MVRRITPYVGLAVLGFALSACAETPPDTHAKLDTGSHQTGQSGAPQSGGAAAVGTRPSGAISTTPTQ